jgi:hypothetical protein
MSRFDEPQFVAGFEAAGGKWLHVDADGIVLADGSHVTAANVPEFSRRLAEAIVAARAGAATFATNVPPVR